MQVIAFTKVKLPYGWLGNMSPHPISYDGHVYKTAEHLFQALRFPPQMRSEMRDRSSPMGAKMRAKALRGFMGVAPRSGQDLDNMRMVLRLKTRQHSSVLIGLLTTADALIIEDCTRRPSTSGLFWGAACRDMAEQPLQWRGENALGKMWMELREELRKEAAQ